MKVMVLGATGMAGHVVNRYLREQGHEMFPHLGRSHIDFTNGFGDLIDWVNECDPDVIVNCVGILVKPSADNPELATLINGQLPHVLAGLGRRLFHLSTDCVFSGKRGNYTEVDEPDETKVYGATKAMGDVNNDRDLTVRVSIIGPEIGEGTGLFAWAKSEAGNKIRGYNNAYWNGITTLELAKFIQHFVEDDDPLNGLLHLYCAPAVSKLTLLHNISDSHKLDLEIESVALPEKIDKTLTTNRGETGYEPSTIEEQLQELRAWYLD